MYNMYSRGIEKLPLSIYSIFSYLNDPPKKVKISDAYPTTWLIQYSLLNFWYLH